MKVEKNSYKLVIPDSSILIKWLVYEEEDNFLIEKMKKDFDDERIRILIPSIILWEVGNYLGRKYQPEKASAAFSILMAYRFKEAHCDSQISNIAFHIMAESPKISFYDASYHALALHSGGVFITADQKYYTKAKKWKNIRLLKDYGSW